MDVSKSCRCCLSNDCYKDLSSEYLYGGEKEIYSDMLSRTFNITISEAKEVNNLICENCITSLREAARFKMKVESSDKTILKLLEEKFVNVKKECNSDYEDRVDDDFVWDVGDSEVKDKGQNFVIKLESNTADKVTSEKPHRVKRSLKVNGNKKREVEKEKRGLGKKRRQTLVVRNMKEDNDVSHTKRAREKSSTSQFQIASRENSLKLVSNSNLCLFKSLKTKFGCFHCKDSFLTTPELREHAKTHCNLKSLRIRFNLLKGLSYKSVDISGLACKICTQTCLDLDDLKAHLIEAHKVEFQEGDHFLIPYNLERGLKCVLCDQEFNTFTRLAIHMNSHYPHNVCEICGVSYINRLSLRMHVSSVHTEKKCSQCSATFSTHYLKVKHMMKEHNIGAYKRYCLLCNQTFRYTYLLYEHRIQEHGAKRLLSDCSECGKTFLSPQNLKVHIRSVHAKERNHACGVCGMGFFTKCDQKRHERTHEDVRSFSCGFCEGRFKTKDSWRRHLKRQHGQYGGQ